jgi:hypothetical protein
MKRTKIVEIIAAKSTALVPLLLLILVFVQLLVEKQMRIFALWMFAPTKSITSLFYNKKNDSLIMVSVYASENFSSLKCKSTRIWMHNEGQAGWRFCFYKVQVFKMDLWNMTMLMLIFDLKNYTSLCLISDRNVQEIKISCDR